MIHVFVGGSFDPVHLGHVQLFEHVQHTLERHCPTAQAYALPTKGSPFKQAPTAFEHRVAMLELALTHTKVCIEPIEQHWPDQAYSAQVFKALKQKHQGVLVLVMGMDSYASLKHWFKASELSQLMSLWVVRRKGTKAVVSDQLGFKAVSSACSIRAAGQVFVDPFEPAHVSSTFIRDTFSDACALVPEPVKRYIRDNQLYKR